MKNENAKQKFEKFTWKIENFSKLDCNKLYSDKILLDHHTWQILVYPKGDKVRYFSIYLVAGVVNLPFGWRKYANFKFALINQANGNTKIKSKSEQENQVDQPVRKIDDTDKPIQQEHTHNFLANKETFTTSFGELVDFRGLGKIEQAFVPLLEEVCYQHPSLIDSKQKHSGRFVEWSFTALGRVLHFLKTKKVKDMDGDACNHLQILWEELKMFRFDLTWLEPHVQSALGMKTCIERADQVKRMGENVSALEMEAKRFKAKMIQAEVDLEIARRDLVKAKEGFQECDLEAELGYGEGEP